jgi:hypothetical protein
MPPVRTTFPLSLELIHCSRPNIRPEVSFEQPSRLDEAIRRSRRFLSVFLASVLEYVTAVQGCK